MSDTGTSQDGAEQGVGGQDTADASQADHQGPGNGTDEGQTREPETDAKAEVEKWKALARKNEERAKSNLEKARAWEQYQDSRKSAEEKQAEQLKALQQERDEAVRQAAVLNAITKHGLSAEDADLLGSGTAEEIEARAQKLAARVAKPRVAPDSALGRERAVAPKNNDWLREQFSRG